MPPNGIVGSATCIPTLKKARAQNWALIFTDEASFRRDSTLHATWSRVGCPPEVPVCGSSPGLQGVSEDTMHVGHFAVALIAKRIEPKLSVGTVTFASMFPDVLWCVFMLAGVEHVRFKPGITVEVGVRAIDVLEAPDIVYSHSLVMGVIWAALLAVVYFSARRYSAGATVIFVAVLSHWVLDFVSHPPDMPLAPGIDKRLGLGLWNSIPATIIVEGLLWLAAIVLYLRATQTQNRTGRWFSGSPSLSSRLPG